MREGDLLSLFIIPLMAHKPLKITYNIATNGQLCTIIKVLIHSTDLILLSTLLCIRYFRLIFTCLALRIKWLSITP